MRDDVDLLGLAAAQIGAGERRGRTSRTRKPVAVRALRDVGTAIRRRLRARTRGCLSCGPCRLRASRLGGGAGAGSAAVRLPAPARPAAPRRGCAHAGLAEQGERDERTRRPHWPRQPSTKHARSATAISANLPQAATRPRASRVADRNERLRATFCTNYRLSWTPLAGMRLDARSAMRFAAAAVVCLLAGCPSSQDPGLTRRRCRQRRCAAPTAGLPARSCRPARRRSATGATRTTRVAARRLRARRLDHRHRDDEDRRRASRRPSRSATTRSSSTSSSSTATGSPTPRTRARAPTATARSTRSCAPTATSARARAAIDWRDAIMYFVMIDRFADGDPANNAPVVGRRAARPVPGRRLRRPARRRSTRATSTTSASTRCGSRRRSTTPTTRTPAPTATATPAITATGRSDLDAAESQARHRGRAQGDGRRRARARHPGAHRLRDEPRARAAARSTQQHPDWFWPNDNGCGGNCVCGGGCSWDARSPALLVRSVPARLQLPQRRRAHAGRSTTRSTWAKRIGVDGFRLDAVKHIETSWLTDVRARLNAEVAWDQKFYMVGETFDGDRGIIKSYVDPEHDARRPVRLPAARPDARRRCCAATAQMSDLAGFLDANDGYYGPGSVMSTFIGNHDVPRAIHLARRHADVRRVGRRQGPRVERPAAAADRRRTRSSAWRSRTRSCSRCPACR